MEENFNIGIIGGAGKMGSLFKRFFQKKGYNVLISDKEVGLPLNKLLNQAKIILISLPIEIFPKVIMEMAPLVRDSHWIMDICSLKYEPAKIMKKYLKKGELLATHPLFGPFEEDLKGKTIAYYPLRGKNFASWLVSLCKEEGLRIVCVPPKKHDEVMAIVQALNHFIQIILAKTLKDTKFSLEEILSLYTPSFLKQLEILRRLSKQDEHLYAHIQLKNPFAKKIRTLFCKNCQNLNNDLIKGGERAYKVFLENFLLAKNLAKDLEALFSIEKEN
ncbi:MAG: prephenate dehydrogenase/arogenate dehydrogenase family protein [Caldimicrobium sp.]